MDRSDAVIGFFVGFFCGLLFTPIALHINDEIFERKAIKAKVAEYYLDENNQRQFRFKDIK